MSVGYTVMREERLLVTYTVKACPDNTPAYVVDENVKLSRRERGGDKGLGVRRGDKS